jgi:F0F1-type ATP synthase membrane subunit b/b'
MKQVIDNRDMVDKLNDLNHDYQRMRKLAKKRRSSILDKINKERAKQEHEIQRKLGGESWVEVEKGWVRYGVWLIAGVLLGSWFF